VLDMTTTYLRRLPHVVAPDSRVARNARRIVAGLMLFTAAGAVYGGVSMLRNPRTPMGATTDLLAGSPFHTFTWPGVVLLLLVGIVPLAVAVGVIARIRGSLLLAGAWGVGLIGWIVTQWVLLDDRLWLQPLFFVVGLAVAVAALYGRHVEQR
jgi:hypothetical protein